MSNVPTYLKTVYLSVSSLLICNPWLISCSDFNDSNEVSFAADIDDQGDVQIIYSPPQDPNHEEIYEIFQETQEFDSLAADINETIALPRDILVKFEECDEENAFYDPETVEISMCYELIQMYKEIFADDAESDEEYVTEVIDAALFTFYHELGHALVDQLELPITGSEEDAVDELAAIILLEEQGELGEDSALAGAFQFDVDAEEEAEFEELPYWDDHSLSKQRFYNTLCLVYGSNPQEFAFLVEDGDLPEERAEICESEYERKVDNWDTLLSPYWK